jgi:hypothetical protein
LIERVVDAAISPPALTSAGKSAQAQSRFGSRVTLPPDLSGHFE